MGLQQVVHSLDVHISPEGLNDVRGDGSPALVSVGLPRQRNAVFGHVGDDGFVRWPRQLERLRGMNQ